MRTLIQQGLVLQKYALPVTGPPFDQTFAYIRENY